MVSEAGVGDLTVMVGEARGSETHLSPGSLDTSLGERRGRCRCSLPLRGHQTSFTGDYEHRR